MKYICSKCLKEAEAKDFDEIVENKKLCKVCAVNPLTSASKRSWEKNEDKREEEQ